MDKSLVKTATRQIGEAMGNFKKEVEKLRSSGRLTPEAEKQAEEIVKEMSARLGLNQAR
jgi:Sec-independent protein translocase protein TatA